MAPLSTEGWHSPLLYLFRCYKIGSPKRFVYSSAMRTSPTSFIVILGISLLSMQLSGLHMHVNPAGAGGLHGTHVHETDADGHGHIHEHDTDVSLFELATSWGKLFLFLPSLLFILPIFVQSGRTVWTLLADTFQRRRRSRWRPPLRAPPLPLS